MGGGCSAQKLAADDPAFSNIEGGGAGPLVDKQDKLRTALQGEDGVEARRALLRRVWREVDADGSGQLEHEELQEVLSRMGREEGSVDMSELDADGSGSVDYGEFREWFLRQDVASQVGLAAVSTSATGRHKPFLHTRSGPTLIGRSAHLTRLQRSAGGGSKAAMPAEEDEADRRAEEAQEEEEVGGGGDEEGEREVQARVDAEEWAAVAAVRGWGAGDGLWESTRHVHLDNQPAVRYQIESDGKKPDWVSVRRILGQAEAEEQAEQTGRDPMSMRSRKNYVESGFPFPPEGTALEGRGRRKPYRGDEAVDAQGEELRAKVFRGSYTAHLSPDEQTLTWSDGDRWERLATRNRTLLDRLKEERRIARYEQSAEAMQKRAAEEAARRVAVSDDEQDYYGGPPAHNWLDAGRALRQSVLPCLTLPCSPLPAGRGGVTKDDGHWARVQSALAGARPRTLSQLRELINEYAPGYLGLVGGGGGVTIAGLSEMMEHFPETRRGGATALSQLVRSSSFHQQATATVLD
jgi:hypothetical protein